MYSEASLIWTPLVWNIHLWGHNGTNNDYSALDKNNTVTVKPQYPDPTYPNYSHMHTHVTEHNNYYIHT